MSAADLSEGLKGYALRPLTRRTARVPALRSARLARPVEAEQVLRHTDAPGTVAVDRRHSRAWASSSGAEEHYLGALQTALAAIAIEPIRETVHRIVIEVHIAEGNVASALKHYHRYRGLLQRELGVVPSQRMDHLVRSLMSP